MQLLPTVWRKITHRYCLPAAQLCTALHGGLIERGGGEREREREMKKVIKG
jgi:hypothetical protein